MLSFHRACAIALAIALFSLPSITFAQGYGTDTQNVLTPAAGGMAGASIARPQDAPAALFGNPATLAQFRGTQFTIGGAWAEGYPTVTRHGFANPANNFSVTSGTEGFVIPQIAVVQDLRGLGLPGNFGIGLAGTSGIGAEYRGRAPAGSVVNDFSTEYMVLGLNAGLGLELTDQLSIGVTTTIGTAFEQIGLVPNSAMVHDYALRATLGANYDLNEFNTIGAFYQTQESFQFPNAMLIAGTYRTLHITQPETVGFGFANRALMDGNLLLAFDAYYKLWENANGYSDIFRNQWAFAFGSQLTVGKSKLRAGYGYNTNPVNHSVGSSFAGLPVLQDRLYLLQASETAVINQHRLTGGIGWQDVMIRGFDLDMFVGGLFKATDNFGPNTTASVAAWYMGLGLTWRYGDRCCGCQCGSCNACNSNGCCSN